MTENEVDLRVKALLLLSHSHLSESEKGKALEICSGLKDWNSFILLSKEKFVTPTVFRHLSDILDPEIFENELKTLLSITKQYRIWALNLNAALTNFHKTCIAPINVKHVYLKGPALASRHYDEPMDRYARDIDILVEKNAYQKVVRTALRHNYNILIGDEILSCPPDEKILRALLRYNPVVAFMSPEGVQIEIHTDVDKKLGVLTPEYLLADPCTIEIGCQHMMVPSIEKEFAYICFHHSRHGWSRLHWLTDIDSMRRNPNFDHEITLKTSRELGLYPTVVASLELLAASKRYGDSVQDGYTSNVQDLLSMCVRNLAGGMEVELDFRSRHDLADLPFRWLLSRKARLRAVTHRTIARFSPSFYQYEAYPLPDRWQWMYWLLKPISAYRKKLSAHKGDNSRRKM